MDYKEIFDRYLDGRLSGEELRAFERKLREDPRMADELDQYSKLHSVSEKLFTDESVDRQAKEHIADYRKQDQGNDKDLNEFKKVLNQTGRRRILSPWYAAAVIIAAVLTFALVRLLGDRTGLPEMFAEYYEPFSQTEELMEFTRSNDDLYFAVRVFESGDYSRAALLFNQLADSSGFKTYSDFIRK